MHKECAGNLKAEFPLGSQVCIVISGNALQTGENCWSSKGLSGKKQTTERKNLKIYKKCGTIDMFYYDENEFRELEKYVLVRLLYRNIRSGGKLPCDISLALEVEACKKED